YSKIVGPIQQLTGAASRIAKGELNTPIAYSSENEIGELAKSIKQMARELNEYFEYIHAQAFTDAMTGVGNKAAYLDAIRKIDRKIIEHMADFGIVVFDINGLKRVNDNMGHEFGDKLISDAASVMKLVYGAEKVFRVGGDEFTVIVEGVESSDMDLYFDKFNLKLEEFNMGYRKYDMKLAISKGYAIYDRLRDGDFQAVFKRADEAMYADKERFYSGNNDRRRGR
nr:diguanylate cyclase [Lachnospiraceae bacterium]